MNRIFLVACICCGLSVSSFISAQDKALLERFFANVSKSCVELTYDYSARVSGVNNVGQGILSAQGYMWMMDGNGVKMCCDSSSLWVMDPAMKEVVIEPAAAGDDALVMTNPATFLMHLNEMFLVRETRKSSDGKSVLYILDPKSKDKIEYFNVEISADDASVQNASFALTDGTYVKIKVSSMKLTPKRPVEDFRPQIVFDSSWIVTDLR